MRKKAESGEEVGQRLADTEKSKHLWGAGQAKGPGLTDRKVSWHADILAPPSTREQDSINQT